MRVFLAGATGAIGRRLVPLLLQAGHAVTGTTRSPERAAALEAAGVAPAVVDALDGRALRDAVVAAAPEAIIHQLTDLPQEADRKAIEAAGERNARLRRDGTQNLVDAALAAGTRRLVAQSIAFVYAPGPQPWREDAPLAGVPEGKPTPSVEGVLALEHAVTGTPGIDGVVLRYGRLYGPGTWTQTPPAVPLHVDAAAHAALLALTRGAPGLYNIAEDDGTVATGKARRELGFDPGFRLK